NRRRAIGQRGAIQIEDGTGSRVHWSSIEDQRRTDSQPIRSAILSGRSSDRKLGWDSASGNDRVCTDQLWPAVDRVNSGRKSMADIETRAVAVLSNECFESPAFSRNKNKRAMVTPPSWS